MRADRNRYGALHRVQAVAAGRIPNPWDSVRFAGTLRRHRPTAGLGSGPQTRGWGPAEFTSAGAGENPPMTEAKQIPNLQDDVRFVSTLPGRVAEEIQQRGPHYGDGRRRLLVCLASKPTRSVTEHLHGSSSAAELRRAAPAYAARWPCTSLVSRRIRFDSERRLRQSRKHLPLFSRWCE